MSNAIAGPSKPPATKPYRRLVPPKPISTHAPAPTSTAAKQILHAGRRPTPRDVVLVSRATSLGMYMRRCKELLMDEGHSQVTIHAMGAAIPHAMQLLFALLDVLPFPKKHVYHEIRTTSIECVDEVDQVNEDGDGIEEDEAERRVRMKSGIEIFLRIGKEGKVLQTQLPAKTKSKAKSRPSASKRRAARRAVETAKAGNTGNDNAEEEMMNA